MGEARRREKARRKLRKMEKIIDERANLGANMMQEARIIGADWCPMPSQKKRMREIRPVSRRLYRLIHSALSPASRPLMNRPRACDPFIAAFQAILEASRRSAFLFFCEDAEILSHLTECLRLLDRAQILCQAAGCGIEAEFLEGAKNRLKNGISSDRVTDARAWMHHASTIVIERANSISSPLRRRLEKRQASLPRASRGMILASNGALIVPSGPSFLNA